MWYSYVILFLFCQINTQVLASPSVIIIGAGPAGIAAATKLLENSVTNITILEAENRIGGRVSSVRFCDTIVELGAENCHGEKGNIVYELAKGFNILEPSEDYFQRSAYYSNGSKIDSSFTQQMDTILYDYKAYENESYNTTGKTIKDLFVHRYNSALMNIYKNDSSKHKISNEELRYAEGFMLIGYSSFSWIDISAESSYTPCEGEQFLIWKESIYRTILEILMKSYPDPKQKLAIDDRLFLNSKVQKINWSEKHTASVTTTDNTAYSADYVIFTPSVGVLKRQKDKLFNPSLPLSKLEAIEAIGFGGIIKFFVSFSEKWWNDEENSFQFFWSDEDIKQISFSHGPTKNGVSWVVQIRDFEQVSHSPNVWIGWVTGDLVPEIEKLPLEVLKNGCEYVLNKFLRSKYNVTTISKIIRSNWRTNENFLGTYSYPRAGFYKKGLSYQEKLSEPWNNVAGKPMVLFAGEATHPTHFSTVHGAIETGHREAERIIKLHKKTN